MEGECCPSCVHGECPAGGLQPPGSRLSRVRARRVPAGPAGSLGLRLRSSGPGLPAPHIIGASRSSGSPQTLTAPRRPSALPLEAPRCCWLPDGLVPLPQLAPCLWPPARQQPSLQGSPPPPMSPAALTGLVAFSDMCSACPGLGVCRLLAWAGAGSPWRWAGLYLSMKM